jgi:uncharacterized protein YrzB (UPF0473 family)
MDNELTFEMPKITLDLEGGEKVACEIIALFEAGEYDYIALYPEKEEEDGEVLIYRYETEEDGTPTLVNIESDEEFELVAQAFDELQDEWEEEFAEEDEE